ncbi:MAG: hypothetical protein ABJE95_07180 [Byssovorax sp.]
MKNALGLFAALVLSTSTSTLGCEAAPDSPPPGADRLDFPVAPRGAVATTLPSPASREAPHLAAWPEVMTWTSQGDLAVVDGRTGTVKQLAPTSHLGGEVDLVFDPWTSEAAVFELDNESQSGEITSYPALPGPSGIHLEPRVHRAWIDGEARLLAAPLGLVIFEQSYGERWKVLFDDQHTTSSVSAPCPASAWITEGAGQGFTVHALSYSEAGPLLLHASDVSPHHVADLTTSSLGVAPAGDPPTARAISAPALGGAALFDVVGSDLAVRLVSGPSASPAALVPLGASELRVEHVLAFDGGQVALLLLSGDSRVMAVELAADGAVKSTATLALPGTVREERRFFSHDLSALGPRRALAATSAGVLSIRMTRSGAGVGLALDPSFSGAALRGPIAVLAPHSPW